MVDILTVGHVTIDFIASPSFEGFKKSVGGPPTYASIAASNLRSKVAVLSRVGGDFPAEYLKLLTRWKVDLSHLKRCADAKTTKFLIRYMDGQRELRLIDLAPPIEVTEDILRLDRKVIHVSPVASEVSYQVFRRLCMRGSLVSLDPQGYLRSFDEHGLVSLVELKDKSILTGVEVLKTSSEEASALTGFMDPLKAVSKLTSLGVEVVIVTLGGEGAFIGFGGKTYFIPSFKVEEVVDPTGAGDSFVGAFLSEYVKDGDAVWSACVGSASASFIVEGIGVSRLKGCREVYERAESILEEVVKKR
ncbi:hypothetical protein DRO28_00530 [Candidatus Bathyarchaeota archaeon]|nr:MAG: hypothetical protein DRO28_00530 [Candidatus Bathyarchaeota archaeon]